MTNLVLTPWKAAFLKCIRDAKRSIFLISPFMKFNIVSAIHREVADKDVVIRTITRCKLTDFAAGASDLDALYALSGLGRPDDRFQLKIDNRLHAKIFIFDDELAFIGSSNITFSGLQRNYEAVVQIDDPKFISHLMEESGRYWNSAQAIDAELVSTTLENLRKFSRSRPVQNDKDEHYFVPDIFGDTIAEPAKDAFEQELIDASVNATPSDPAYEFTPRITSLEVSVERSDQEKLDEFLATLRARFNIDYSASNIAIYAAALFGDAGSYQRAFDQEKGTLTGTGLPPPAYSALGMLGHSIWDLGLATIAARSGLLRRFGPSGASMFCAAANRLALLSTLWDQNLLGSPTVMHGATLGLNGKHDAAFRLFGAIALNVGIPQAIDLLEEFFNPTDLLGDDIISLMDVKDNKTLLQEAVQARKGRLTYDDHVQLGDAHDRTWKCVVRIGGLPAIEGIGAKKAGAEAAAAEAALRLMWTDNKWRPILTEIRQNEMDTVRRYAPWKIEPKVPKLQLVEAVGDSFRADTGIDLPDTVIFPAFVDKEVRRAITLDFDNQALGFLGAAVLNATTSMYAFRQGEFDISSVQRRVYAQSHELVDLDNTWNLIPVKRADSRALRTTILQALIGGAIVRLGRTRALEFAHSLISKPAFSRSSETTLGKQSGFLLLLNHSPAYKSGGNYAETLQRFAQSFGVELPAYSFVSSGPLHDPTFRAIVKWKTWSSSGQASSKRGARDQAAFELLTKLQVAHSNGELSSLQGLAVGT